MNNHLFKVSKLYLSFVLVLAINCFDCRSQIGSDSTYNIDQLEKEIDTNIKSLKHINTESHVSYKNILSKLIILNKLKYNKHDSLCAKILLKNDTNTIIHRNLTTNIVKHTKNIFANNFKLLNQEIISDTLSFIKKITKNHSICFACINIANDISNSSSNTKSLFKSPLNIESISEYYNIASDILLPIIEDDDDIKNTQKETIIKGYSPFSNEHQKFIVFADSIKKTETKTSEQDLAVHQPIKKDINLNKNDSSLRNKNQPPLPLDLINKYDKESLKKYWQIYQAQLEQNNELALETENTPKDTVLNKTILHSNTLNTLNLIHANNTHLKYNLDEDTITNTSKKPASIEKDTTYYFVQIAASRTPITKSLLKSLYNGSDSVIIRQEEGWFKYQLGKTPDYIIAKNLLKKINVTGAFLSAYKKNHKQVLWRSINSRQITNPTLKLTFVLQVSANLKPIKVEQRAALQNKVGGFVREIIEDGWYKYQFVIGSSYTKAVVKWKQTGTNNTFLVAYYNNEKITMTKAIEIFNSNKID